MTPVEVDIHLERLHDSSPSHEHRRLLSEQQRTLLRRHRQCCDEKFLGAHGAQGFRCFLIRRYGTLVAGWRALDKDKQGALGFMEFCNNCRELGYHGKMLSLWRELDLQGMGQVSLMHLDEDTGKYVGVFKYQLYERYGGDFLIAWRQALDVQNRGYADVNDIVACVQRLGLKGIDGKRLAGMLISGRVIKECDEGMCPVLTLEDFDPPAYYQLLCGGAMGDVSHL